jgi:hypothetical protein
MNVEQPCITARGDLAIQELLEEGSSEFYEKFGFQGFTDEKNRLFISIEMVRKSFGA